VSILEDGDYSYAPPTVYGGYCHRAWWNVLTFGNYSRCTQLAFFSFMPTSGGGLIYMRYQHDYGVTDWTQVL